MSEFGEILRNEEYALCLSPGFFQFYSEMGFLHALQEADALHATHVSGSSAGAIVGGFLAAGMKPNEMLEPVFSIKRDDIWDVGSFTGLLKGQLFQEILEKFLPVKEFNECKIPLGVCTYDLLRFKTNCITEEVALSSRISLATAIRASATFPVLFSPVMISIDNGFNSPNIDGGFFDWRGCMSLPGVPTSNLIINVVCGRSSMKATLPSKYSNVRLLTVVLENFPHVNPFNMGDMGEVSYNATRLATHRALVNSTIEKINELQWCVYIDGSLINPNYSLKESLNDYKNNVSIIENNNEIIKFANKHKKYMKEKIYIIKEDNVKINAKTHEELVDPLRNPLVKLFP
jgi:NTE family protein